VDFFNKTNGGLLPHVYGPLFRHRQHDCANNCTVAVLIGSILEEFYDKMENDFSALK